MEWMSNWGVYRYLSGENKNSLWLLLVLGGGSTKNNYANVIFFFIQSCGEVQDEFREKFSLRYQGMGVLSLGWVGQSVITQKIIHFLPSPFFLDIFISKE